MKKDIIKFVSVIMSYVLIISAINCPVMADEIMVEGTPAEQQQSETIVDLDDVAAESEEGAEDEQDSANSSNSSVADGVMDDNKTSNEDEMLAESSAPIEENLVIEETTDALVIDEAVELANISETDELEEDALDSELDSFYSVSIKDSDKKSFDSLDDAFSYINTELGRNSSKVHVCFRINQIPDGGVKVDSTVLSCISSTNRNKIEELKFLGDIDGKVSLEKLSGINLGIDIQSSDYVELLSCDLNSLKLYGSRVSLKKVSSGYYTYFDVPTIETYGENEIYIDDCELQCDRMICHDELPVLSAFTFGYGSYFNFRIAELYIHCNQDEIAKLNTSNQVKHRLLLREKCEADNYNEKLALRVEETFVFADESCKDAVKCRGILKALYENEAVPQGCFVHQCIYSYCAGEYFLYSYSQMVAISLLKEDYSLLGSMHIGDTFNFQDRIEVSWLNNSGRKFTLRGNANLTYSSNNTRVASVNEEGILTAHNLGNAIVTVKSKDNPAIIRTIHVKVVNPITAVVLDYPSETVKGISKTKITAKAYPETDSNAQIAWSVYSKYGDGEYTLCKNNGIAKVTTVSTSGAVTVGELSVNTLLGNEDLKLKVRATATNNLNDGSRKKTDSNDYLYAEKEISVVRNAPVTAISLKPESTTVAGISDTVIKATFMPNDEVVDERLVWSVYKVEGGTKTLLTTDSGIYIVGNKKKPEATLHVDLSTRSAIDAVSVKAVSASNYDDGTTTKNASNDFVYGTADIKIASVIVPKTISFDKKEVDLCYGESATLNVKPSSDGANPSVTLSLWRKNQDGSRTQVTQAPGVRVTNYSTAGGLGVRNKTAKVVVSVDRKTAKTGNQSYILKATSTYAYNDGTNRKSDSNALISDETTINIMNRYTISDEQLILETGEERKVSVYDNKNKKAIKPASWKSGKESVAYVSADGVVKALKGGTTSIQPCIATRFTTGTYLQPICIEDGRGLVAQVRVAENVLDPTVSVAGGRTELQYGDEVSLNCFTEDAKIYYSLNSEDDEKPLQEYSGPIIVGEDTTLPLDGIRDQRIITLKVQARKSIEEGESAESPIRTYAFRVNIADESIGEVETEDVPNSQISSIPKGLWVADISAQDYTGDKIVPDVRVYYGKKKLIKNTDYTVSATNNINAHDSIVDKKSPQVTVTFRNSYSGKITKTFAINKVDLASSDNITMYNYDSHYTGRDQYIVPTVLFNGKTLKNKTDYYVEYPEKGTLGAYNYVNKNATNGYAITVKAGEKSNFVGERTVYLKIRDDVLLSNCSISKIAAQKYTGNAVKPQPTITYKGKKLVLGEHYNVSYSDNIMPGKAKITISCIDGSGYYGTIEKEFAINPINISASTITGLDKKYLYNGSPVDPFGMDNPPIISINNGSDIIELAQGTDYSVSYTKNNTSGTATITIKGEGKYTGAKTFRFGIDAYDIKTDSLNAISVTYPTCVSHSNSGATPPVTLTYNGRKLIENQEYTVKYSNNKAVGQAGTKKAPTIVITGKGPYKGSITKEFSIARTDIADMTIYADEVVYKNKGGNYSTKVKITDLSGKTLTAGKDYDKQLFYFYTTQTSVIDATTVKKGKTPITILRSAGESVGVNDIVPINTTLGVQVLGLGNYKGTKLCTYRIAEKNIASTNCTVNRTIYYTGKPIYLNVSDIVVKANGKQIDSSNYKIVGYEKNLAVGNASVIIRGQGAYVGDKKVTFKILKVPGK